MLSNEDIQEQARQVLADEEFQAHVSKDSGSFDLAKWLSDLFDWKLPANTLDLPPDVLSVLGVVLKYVLILCLALAVAYALYCAIRKWRTRPADENGWRVTEEERQEMKQSYTQLAAEALKRQDYRNAMHYLFLASVSLVIQDDKFHGAAFMTNREIAAASDFSRLGEDGDLKTVFETLVYSDETHWFGHRTPSKEDFDRFSGTYQRFQTKVQPHGR